MSRWNQTPIGQNQSDMNSSTAGSAIQGREQPNTKQQAVIAPRQSPSLIASTIIGVGVLTLPRITSQALSEAAWISTLAGALISIGVIWVLTRLGLRFPYMSIVDYLPIILGSSKKGIGKGIGIVLTFPIVIGILFYWLGTTASISRTFGEVVVGAVLVHTPIEVLIATMLLLSFVLTMYEVEVLARVNEILLPIIVVPVLFIALLSFQSFELDNILPIWPDLSIKQFLYGILITCLAYQGFEIITILSAYTHVSKKNSRLNIIGVIIPSVIFLLIVIAGISVFGVEELDQLMWPTLELVKVTQAPGQVLERMESAFLGVWVAAVFSASANLYYVSTILISKYFKLARYRRWVSLGLLPIIFWLSLLPRNVIQLFDWQLLLSFAGAIITFVLPILMLLLAIVRKKGVRQPPYEDGNEDENESDSSSSRSRKTSPNNKKGETANDGSNSKEHNTSSTEKRSKGNDQGNKSRGESIEED
ncbi:GerAB/ArcD/ProY family transporter [Bacillus horti]|uniref:Spore germination protein n=1 Tax=Caldalkalibacillus horti TaxID=77523 RepID=A0ABT9VUC2_9BACI|nr:endospore germination permease [Bacillus horti]MDQ0164586.1 spore germination protein [Bacillus horti]